MLDQKFRNELEESEWLRGNDWTQEWAAEVKSGRLSAFAARGGQPPGELKPRRVVLVVVVVVVLEDQPRRRFNGIKRWKGGLTETWLDAT